MDFISLCDGKNSLIDIAETLNIPVWDLYKKADELKKERIIKNFK